MKVGFVQFAPALGNVQVTLAHVDRLACRTVGADLLVLPELCNSGYNFTSRQQAWETSEEIGSSAFLEHLARLCRENGSYVATGFNEREGNRLFNSAVLVGPQGVIGCYRKLHLFMNEKDYFQPGDAGLPVFDIGLCRVGMLVCFDWAFPEAWRILALRGADVICHPSNLVLPGLGQRAASVHALTSAVYVVTANRIGTEGPLTFTGGSIVAGPKGEVLLQATPNEEEVGLAQIDISRARDKNITRRNNLLGDRRPSEYGALVES